MWTAAPVEPCSGARETLPIFSLPKPWRWAASLSLHYTSPRELLSTQTSQNRSFYVHKTHKQTKAEGSRVHERTVARAVLCKQTGMNFKDLLPVQRAHTENHCLFYAKLGPTCTQVVYRTEAKSQSGGKGGRERLLGKLLLLATTYPCWQTAKTLSRSSENATQELQLHLQGKKNLRSCFFADSAGRGYLLRKSAETREATARSCSPCLRFSECLAYVLVSAKVWKHILFPWMHR